MVEKKAGPRLAGVLGCIKFAARLYGDDVAGGGSGGNADGAGDSLLWGTSG